MKPQWFPFYVADWRASRRVQAMLPLARWIYFDLLCEQFDQPTHSLPDDPAELAAISGLSLEEFQRYWPSVRPCFTVRDDGRLENPRLKAECVGMETRIAKQKQQTREAANRRWDRQLPLDLVADDARALRAHVHSTNNTHSTDKQPRARARGPLAPHEYLADCPHEPRCATVGLCSRRRDMDGALADGRLTVEQARRLERLWRAAPAWQAKDRKT